MMVLQSSMIEVLRLTRTGDVAQATALIQAALGGGAAVAPHVRAAKVIDLIPARVTVAPSHRRAEPGPISAPSSFEMRRHSGPAGTIDYMLYRPAAASPGLPLVVMLHGCTQSPEDFARGTDMNRLADELGFLVAYPQQTRAANAQKCWNWFRPGDQQRGRGEPALIAGLTREIVESELADANRIYVAGLSAGGAAAAIMADAYPDVFAAVGIHSGLPCGSARNLPGALSAMRHGNRRSVMAGADTRSFVPTIVFHGDRDATVHDSNADDIVALATAATGGSLDVDVEAGTCGSRNYTRALSRDAAGHVVIEQWTIAGAGHAWSGGNRSGSYADPDGPDASRAMLGFFVDQSLGTASPSTLTL